MTTLPDYVLLDAMEEIGVLHALGLRLMPTSPETANTVMSVAHELWKIQKGLSGRQVKFDLP